MDLNRLMVAIPSRANLPGLEALLGQLAPLGVGRVVVYDNGYAAHALDHLTGQAEIVDAHGWKFYSMWNDAWKESSFGYDAVAILNDDITLHEGSLGEAFRVLMSSQFNGIVGLNYDRPTTNGTSPNAGSREVSGSFRNHGIGGHAFLIRSSTYGDVPSIDDGYALWYGDDELFAAMSAYGYALKIALGAPVDHATSVTSVQFPELLAQTDADARLFASRWG